MLVRFETILIGSFLSDDAESNKCVAATVL